MPNVTESINDDTTPYYVGNVTSGAQSTPSLGATIADPTIVVGIDFGTEHSGFSYAIKSENMQRVNGDIFSEADLYGPIEWPEQPYPSYKTPTALIYDTTNNKLTHWGWSATLESHRLRSGTSQLLSQYMKLGLQSGDGGTVDDDADSAESQHEKATLPPGKDVVTVIADYLREMKKFIIQNIQKQGIKIRDNDIQWCLTVPAIWTDLSKEKMHMAAQMAGILQGPLCPYGEGSVHELQIVLEPEAAFLYCLQHLQRISPIDWNTAYLTVDIGAGATGAVMYGLNNKGRLVELTSKSDFFQIDHPRSNVCYGCVFQGFLERIFGINWVKVLHEFPGDVNKLRFQWEQYQRYNIRIGGRFSLDIPRRLIKFVDKKRFPVVEDEEVEIEEEFLLSMLRTTSSPIISVIEEQIEALRKRNDEHAGKRVVIFLIGGRAGNSYVQQEIKQRFETYATVFTPSRPEAVVARGAVLYGLFPSSIHERCMRRTYGTEALCNWTPQDPEALREVIHGQEMIRIIEPFLYKGQSIQADSWITREFVSTPGNHNNVIDIKLYATASGVNGGRVYPSDDDMHQIASIHIDVPFGLRDKTMVLHANFGDPVIKVRAFSKEQPERMANVSIKYISSSGAPHKCAFDSRGGIIIRRLKPLYVIY